MTITKKNPKKLKINLHTKIFPHTKQVLDDTLEKWRELFTYEFSQTTLLEIAILRLAEFDNKKDIRDFYNKFIKRDNQKVLT